MKRRYIVVVIFFVLFSMIVPASIAANNSGNAIAPVPIATPETARPPFSSYKGVSIDMPIENARAILGNPKEKIEKQDFYQFSENESVQIFYENGQTVTAIMVTFIGVLDLAPTAKDVFGEVVAPNEDGSFFKMVRYPKAGFWISYSYAATADKMINIAMQKIN